MDYFCYISRSKVDQLYHSIDPEGTDEWTEQQSTEQNIDSSMKADLTVARIFSLFSGGITYGRKGVVQRERKVKIEYVEKLRRVLVAVARDKSIPALASAVLMERFDSLYFHHAGKFAVKDAVERDDPERVVTIQTRIGATLLSLDCSLRYFSEGNEPNGSFILHSGNSRFFKGEIPLQMECVFLLLHRGTAEIIGTPLYLKLSLDTPVAL